MSFAELGLSDKVLKAATAAGYTEPTPIQKQAIPHVLARKDVLGIAQTGTGKTAAFTLPMLTLLESGRARARMPRTLILEPTRELAAQVEENFVKYGSEHKLSVALLIGGVSFGDQDAKITRGVDVLIATPGRLLDHFERGKLLLTGVELFVIDEADRMLDMGFIPDIERIAKLVPFTRQTLFFSATMPSEIQRLADTFLHNPVKVEVERAATAAVTITQRLISTGREPHQKRDTLRKLIREAVDLKNAIVFCNRKRDVATLHRSLQRHGFNATALHGDMDQRARMLALDSFRNGDVTILVASDVAARGLDIPDVSHVFNYDIPYHAEDYIHRIGRAGRAGRAGASFSLVARGDEKALQTIEGLLKNKIEWAGKKLSERTEADDSYSSPDRGRGWKREDGEREGRGGGRNDRGKRRGSRDGRDRRSGPSEHREQVAKPEAAVQENKPADNRRHENRRPHHEAPRHDQRRDDKHRHDQHRRRDRYDNEPDTPIVGFGDHMPAFLARPVTFRSEPEPVAQKDRKPVTPISSPPKDAPAAEPVELAKAVKKKKAPARKAKAAPLPKVAKTSKKAVEDEQPKASEVEAAANNNDTAEAPAEPVKKAAVKKPAAKKSPAKPRASAKKTETAE